MRRREMGSEEPDYEKLNSELEEGISMGKIPRENARKDIKEGLQKERGRKERKNYPGDDEEILHLGGGTIDDFAEKLITAFNKKEKGLRAAFSKKEKGPQKITGEFNDYFLVVDENSTKESIVNDYLEEMERTDIATHQGKSEDRRSNKRKERDEL